MCSMRSVFQWVISGGLMLALGGPNSVADETKQGTRSSPAHEVRRLSMVIGGAVRIANGVSVGKIEDVVLNDSGCIQYVVVVYRDQYVAIPWTVTTVDFRQRLVTVDISEERFATVPTFRRDEFSFLIKTEFTQKVRSVFDVKGEPKPKPADEKAESPKGATKSEPKPEPAKTAVREEPKVESPDKPAGETLDKPKGGESKDKPKAESKAKAKGESIDKAKGEPKDKPRKKQ